jgi:hypothetical protein
MSLLIYALENNQIVVVTDTLVTRPSGDPFLLVSKCSAIPHLEMLVAYTGIAQLGQRWSHRLQTAMLARSIDQLDHLVTPGLQALWAKLQAKFGDPQESGQPPSIISATRRTARGMLALHILRRRNSLRRDCKMASA